MGIVAWSERSKQNIGKRENGSDSWLNSTVASHQRNVVAQGVDGVCVIEDIVIQGSKDGPHVVRIHRLSIRRRVRWSSMAGVDDANDMQAPLV
ncbi:hypothetical protein DYB30_008359 [Aphanomyces astaci]|uniref:Uncharacterized protein n=1 Tax=Aphanomyces astaci TaxID=112090 RepID=A0A397E545_APHAT|nr:hypothetical protein DYB38_010696 [Aphanomyces astaci]RHY53254.1 hypothetical protein DYB34_007733 [Aphanomyces astaci]RHY73293.1 hypothetical protein DYB30_008359 [Aphanomyces astaci]RHZ08643.1 hypothetical protein DYB31_006825 [Aphanomyces astaci]